jgi:hypothetical protein
MSEMPQAWADLIKALTIMSRRPANTTRPTNCGHDRLQVMADDERFTAEEIAELDGLGFYVDADGGFYSYKFGSA